jgi:hypothetical protein
MLTKDEIKEKIQLMNKSITNDSFGNDFLYGRPSWQLGHMIAMLIEENNHPGFINESMDVKAMRNRATFDKYSPFIQMYATSGGSYYGAPENGLYFIFQKNSTKQLNEDDIQLVKAFFQAYDVEFVEPEITDPSKLADIGVLFLRPDQAKKIVDEFFGTLKYNKGMPNEKPARVYEEMVSAAKGNSGLGRGVTNAMMFRKMPGSVTVDRLATHLYSSEAAGGSTSETVSSASAQEDDELLRAMKKLKLDS